MQNQGEPRRVRVPLLQALDKLQFPIQVPPSLQETEATLCPKVTDQSTDFYEELAEGLHFDSSLGDSGSINLKRRLLSQLVGYKLLQHTH